MSRRILLLLTLLLAAAAAHGAVLPKFTQPNAIWNEDVSAAPARSNSAQMMQRLETIAATEHPGQLGNWGDNRANVDFQLDIYSFYVMHATGATPVKPVVAWPDAGSYYTGECEDPGMLFPVPAGGGIEGTGPPPAYTCDAANNDCHTLVGNDSTGILYEAYATNAIDTGVHATCGLYWDLNRVYPRYGRGEHCTSADGAGFPIAPLLFNADEVWAAMQVQGDIGHAIRFAIGNERMMQGAHVHPSSHGTSATSDTDVNAVPYGSRLRLKSTFDVNAFSANGAVRVVLRTLQKYGMFLSDGGQIPLMGEQDYFTTHKWGDADMQIDSHAFFGIKPTDFDVVDAGPPITNSGNCTRTPADFVFIDGFDW